MNYLELGPFDELVLSQADMKAEQLNFNGEGK